VTRRHLRRSAALAAMWLGLVGAAQAHAHLQTSVPAADAVLASAPRELALGFSESVEPGFSGLILRDGAGGVVPTGPARLAPGDDRAIVVPLARALAAGLYTVEWHALAADGHKTQGRYVFTVTP
jgi:methionine-rich copper-binding protein CopC